MRTDKPVKSYVRQPVSEILSLIILENRDYCLYQDVKTLHVVGADRSDTALLHR